MIHAHLIRECVEELRRNPPSIIVSLFQSLFQSWISVGSHPVALRHFNPFLQRTLRVREIRVVVEFPLHRGRLRSNQV